MSVVVDGGDGLIRASLEGAVPVDTVLRRLEGAFTSPGFRPGMNMLLDGRGAAHHLEAEDIARVSRYLIANRDKIEGGKAAVVVAKTVSYGLMRMLQAQVDGMPIGFSVFYDIDEARRWLGLRD